MTEGERAERNIELVLTGWLLAVRKRDLETLVRHLHEDVTWQGVRPDYRCEGREEVLTMVANETDPPGGVHTVELRGNADHVLVGVQAERLEKIGEVDAHGQIFLVFTIRAGRIAGIHDHLTRAEALASAGMTESNAWR